MTQLQTIVNGQTATMSSREIADVADARHNDVMATINRLFDKGLLRSSRKTRQEATGGRPTEVYDLVERDVYLVIAGYSDEVRARIVDRWQELESQAAKPAFVLPQTMAQALRLAATQAEQLEQQAEQLAIAAPKVEALERLSGADGATCITNAAKALGVRPKDLFAKLQADHWIYRRAGGAGFCGYQDKIQTGYLDHKVTTVSRSDGSEKMVEQVLVTPKGLTRLATVLGVQ